VVDIGIAREEYHVDMVPPQVLNLLLGGGQPLSLDMSAIIQILYGLWFVLYPYDTFYYKVRATITKGNYPYSAKQT
jgi:hypothetical protein